MHPPSNATPGAQKRQGPRLPYGNFRDIHACMGTGQDASRPWKPGRITLNHSPVLDTRDYGPTPRPSAKPYRFRPNKRLETCAIRLAMEAKSVNHDDFGLHCDCSSDKKPRRRVAAPLPAAGCRGYINIWSQDRLH